jgi:hypothetical protein
MKATIAHLYKKFFEGSRKTIFFILSICPLLLFIGGCKKELVTPPPTQAQKGTVYNNKFSPYVFSENALSVDSTENLKSNLSGVDPLGVTFSPSTNAQLLQVGKVVFGGPCPLAPLGFIRIITSVKKLPDGSLYCTTTKGNITDVLVQASFNKTVSLSELLAPNPVFSLGSTSGLSRSLASASISTGQDFDLTHDFGVVATSGRLHVDGTATATLVLSIAKAKVQYFELDFKTDKSAAIGVAVQKAFSDSLDTQLFKYPVSIPLDWGLTFNGFLTLNAGMVGSVSGKISLNATYSSSEDTGVEYLNDRWSLINNPTVTQTSFTQPVLTGNIKVSLKPYVKLDLKLSPEDLPIITADLSAEAALPISLTKTSSAESLKANLDIALVAQADATFLGTDIKARYIPIALDVPLLNVSYSIPTITTASLGTITATSVVSGGTIASDGGFPVIQKGTVLNTSHDPTTANIKTTDGIGTGTYTSTETGLTPGTQYYLRAYAVNSLGTAYGSEISFKTSQTNQTGSSPGTMAGNQSGSPGGSPATLPPSGSNPGSQTSPAQGNGNSGTSSGTPIAPINQTPNPGCPTFTYGVLTAQVLNVNPALHTTTFVVRKSDNSAFSAAGTCYVASGCGGPIVGSAQFVATVYSFTFTITDTNVSTNPNVSKAYDLYISQPGVSAKYAAPELWVNF